MRMLLAVAAATFVAVPAQAQRWSDLEVMSVAVPAADLDLSTRAGIDTLESRVARAVNRICGSDRACREEAWASTYAQVDDAIGRDRWMRRLAYQRAAQIEACGYRGCAPVRRVRHAPPPTLRHAPAGVQGGTTVVTIVHGAPAPVTVYHLPPRRWR